MRVIKRESFSIYVYAEDHAPPHCHVRFKDKKELSIILPTITGMYGAKIPKEVKKVIMDNIDALSDMWEELNPEHTHNK